MQAMNTAHRKADPYLVLVGVDYSDVSTLALREALRLARTQRDSRLHVVHAVPSTRPLGTALVAPGLLAPEVARTEADPGDDAPPHPAAELHAFVGAALLQTDA